jgi:hypothetical protein
VYHLQPVFLLPQHPRFVLSAEHTIEGTREETFDTDNIDNKAL